nr:PREDICTED: heat shock factor-binding protein 1-like protein 1 [Phalacrocorax carbo]
MNKRLRHLEESCLLSHRRKKKPYYIIFIFNFLLEEMGERIDDLEKHVADLMTEAGIENTDEELRVKTFLLYFMYFHLSLNYGQHLA